MRTLAKLGVIGTLIGAAAANTACSSREATTAELPTWSCHREAVPMGNVTTCTTRAALVADASYECSPAVSSTSCPPANPPIQTGEGSVEAVPTGGASSDDGSAASGSDDATQGSSGEGSVDGSPNDECSYAPDLDYCGGASGGDEATDGTSGEGSVDGSTGGCGPSGPKKCPPGQTKKPDGSGGTSSGGPSSSGGGGGGGGKDKTWKCEKTEGATTCTSEPTCAPGSHPAPCGACVPDDEPEPCDCVPPTTGGCWVTGGGFVEAASLVPAAPADGHDNFGGNAKPMKDGSVKGQWNHVDHGTGHHAHGNVSYLFCRKVDGAGPGQPGGKKGLVANQVYFGGPARFRADGVWADGYWYDVVAIDRGEPGSSAATKKGGVPDSYHFTIRKESDPISGVSGAVVYETKGGLSGGNIQIHPPNGGHPAVSSPLPAWVALED